VVLLQQLGKIGGRQVVKQQRRWHRLERIALGVEDGHGQHALQPRAAQHRREQLRGADRGPGRVGFAGGQLVERHRVEHRGVAIDDLLPDLPPQLGPEQQDRSHEDGAQEPAGDQGRGREAGNGRRHR